MLKFCAMKMRIIVVEVASNTISRTEKVTIDNETFLIGSEWILHTGIVVRGDQAFQSFSPFNDETWQTSQTDKAYVAVYSYPEFELEKIIEDE